MNEYQGFTLALISFVVGLGTLLCPSKSDSNTQYIIGPLLFIVGAVMMFLWAGRM